MTRFGLEALQRLGQGRGRAMIERFEQRPCHPGGIADRHQPAIEGAAIASAMAVAGWNLASVVLVRRKVGVTAGIYGLLQC